MHAVGSPGLVINNGTVQLAGTGDDQISDSAPVVVNNSGVLDLNAHNEGVGGLSGNGVVTNNATGTSTLTLGAAGTGGGTFTGSIQDGGTGKKVAVIKNGAGALTFDGTNTYTGGMTVNGGALVVNGSLAGSVTVNSTAKLAGPGSIAGGVTVNSGGTIIPGNPPAALTSTGNMMVGGLRLNSGATTQIELGGTTRGSKYAAILASNIVELGGTLNVSLVSYSPTLGDRFDILDWGTRSGTFSTLQLPALSGTLGWNTGALYLNGVLSVIDTNFLPGDFDRDGHVNVADIAAMETALADLSIYRTSHGHMSPAQLVSIGDLDGDGQVTNADLQALTDLLANGGGSGAGGLSVVPEPQSAVLFALGCSIALAWTGSRRSRTA